MKKFLSVLLALAVAFTFTFGSTMSAFAASAVGEPTDTYAANQATLTKEYNDCIAKLADKYIEVVNSEDVVIDKTVYGTIAKEVYDTYMSVLEAQKAVIDADETKDYDDALTGTSYGDLAGKKYTDVNTQEEFNNLVFSTGGQTAYKDRALELAFDGYKDQVKAELNKINLALYSDEEMTDAHYNAAASVSTGNLYKVTYKQYVKDLRDEAVKRIDKVYIAQLTTGEDSNAETRVTAAYTAVQAELALLDRTAAVGTESVYYTVNSNPVFVSYEVAATYNVPTIKDLDASSVVDGATEAALKAIVDGKAATYISENSATTENAAAAKKLAEAYKEVMYSRIENEELAGFNTTDDDDNIVVGGNIPPVSPIFGTLKGYYTELEKTANTLKVTVDATGALIYDAAVIDKNLAKGKIAIYRTERPVTTYDLTTGAKISEQSLDWAKATKIATLQAEMKGKLYATNTDANYYALEQAQIEAKYQAVIDKINAATTAEQLGAIADSVDTSSIYDKEDVIAAIQALSQFAKDKVKLEKYVELLNGDTKSWESGYKAMMDDDTLADFYATNNARTNAEVAALLDAAKAECDKIPTKGEIADAKKAAEDIIKALPDYITIDNKDAVEAAYKAATELTLNYGETVSNSAKLGNAIAQLEAALIAKLDAAVKALPATLTAADKATVDALLAEIEAYETSDMYKAPNGRYAVYAKKGVVEDAFEKVRDAALKDVIAAIAALPADATAEQVEAAKAKYDAFVNDYTDAENNYNAATKVTNYDKLAYLLASIAEADVWGPTEVKASLFDSSRKLTIWRTSKTSIKVTSVGSVADIKDHGYTVEYKFYKKAPGATSYKLVKTTSSNKYTYTNLKKGTNKFQVKVVVKDADSKVVASKWTYYRAAKVK